jgi:hypothetical protein
MMMEQPIPLVQRKGERKKKSKSNDEFVEHLGAKLETGERPIQDKRVMTDRLMQRIGEIVNGLEAAEAQFEQAADHAQRVRVRDHIADLTADLRHLQEVYNKVLKPSREEFMHGPEPLTKDEESLIEKETPYLLVGGKKPMEDSAESGVEMELEDEDLANAETIREHIEKVQTPEERYQMLSEQYDQVEEALKKLELAGHESLLKKAELEPTKKRLQIRQRIILEKMSKVRKTQLEAPRFEKAS